MRRCRKNPMSNPESGQGAVEYILITLITVVLILGLVYQFNQKFKAFAMNYFGNYIACLLETGELPGSKNGLCIEEYQTISQQQGKALMAFSNNGSSSSSNSSSTTAKSSTSSGKTATGEALSSSPGQTSNFNSSGGGGRERESNVNAAVSKKDAEASGYSTLYGSNGAYERGANGARSEENKRQYVNGTDEDGEDKAKAAVTKTGKKTANNNALKPKRVTQDAVRKVASVGGIEDSQFTFGAFIRWIIIAALILIIVIFFGGQLMQIMRSRDKGGGD